MNENAVGKNKEMENEKGNLLASSPLFSSLLTGIGHSITSLQNRPLKRQDGRCISFGRFLMLILKA